ncbi:MAG: hypothetical protein R6U96_18830 [Promethearchaeia archaeon]
MPNDFIFFYNPPSAILASGTKDGVELGGNMSLVSIDSAHNLYAEGNIFSEMSWAEFYKEEGIDDQINTFTPREMTTVRGNSEALIEVIIETLEKIIKERKLFYGIVDFEVDAFMNENTVIPGLKIDYELINKLMKAHKKNRDEDLFPKLLKELDKSKTRANKIKIQFQGAKKNNLHYFGSKLEDFAYKLKMAHGFATGLVCTSKKVANLYIMSDNISFKKEGNTNDSLYIDKENKEMIEYGINADVLFPISWFRIDLGINSLQTLELWDQIKDNQQLQAVLEKYEDYITQLVIKKYQKLADTQKIGLNLGDDFRNLKPTERQQALKDMADALRVLTKKYKE